MPEMSLSLAGGVADVLAAVRAGGMDAILGEIAEAVRDRARTRPLAVGDVVTFNESTSTRYLVGVQAEVVTVPRGSARRFTVRLLPDYPVGRFPLHAEVKVPRAIVDFVRTARPMAEVA